MEKVNTVLKGLTAKINEEEFKLDAVVASDETEDRHGDVLPIDKWDLKNFKKNPVLLDAHDSFKSENVIGKVEKIWIDGKKLMFTPKFAVKENPKAEVIWNLFKGGFLNAFSVGFRYYKKGEDLLMELLEISAVPVPANPNALVALKSAGVEAVESWKEFVDKSVDKKEDIHNKKRYESLQKFDDSDILDRKRSYVRSLKKHT